MNLRKILIAVDDSKYSENAAAWGFDLARHYKADVGLVNIVEPLVSPAAGTDMMTGMPFEPAADTETEILRAQKEASENIIQRTIDKYAGELRVTQYTEYGITADGILSCCNEFGADLIVLGTHSRSGLDRLLLGSIAEHVIRQAQVPVLVVPLPVAAGS